MHGPVCLPADSEDLSFHFFQSFSRCFQRERKLGSRVAAKITDAGSLSIDIFGQAVDRRGLRLEGFPPVVPILAIKAVK